MPQTPTTRKRSNATPMGVGMTDVRGTSGTPVINDHVRVSLGSARGAQVTVSEGHQWPPQKGSFDDIGGDFYTIRQYVEGAENNSRTIVRVRNGIKSIYTGPLLPVVPVGTSLDYNAFYPPSAESSNAQLDALGAKAVALCEPTNSVADASTFLGELIKDGLPSLIGSATWRDRTHAARSAGDEYLNVQFGWRPLLSDVTKFGDAAIRAKTVMEQYERDAGKVVRRSYNFPLIRTVTKTETGLVSSIAPYGPNTSEFHSTNGGAAVPGNRIMVRETTKRQWFKGAFTYHLPSGYDSRNKMDRWALEAKKLFGLTLTPETLWNLAPWSWAVDWFSNAGDVIHNISAYQSNGLIMRYGYIMEHTVVRDTYTLNPTGLFDTSQVVPPLTFITEVKKRRRANPFGFGLLWSGLSPFQLSIAAALGISRK